MKILFVIEDLGPGGAQRQMIALALQFSAAGHQIEFLSYDKKDFYAETLTKHGITHTCLQIKNPLKRIFAFRRFIRNANYEVVLAFLSTPAFLSAFASIPFRKWKLIIGERSANPAMLSSFRAKYLRSLHMIADYVVANSEANLKILKSITYFVKAEKCRVIYNATDLERFSPDESFRFKTEDKLRIIVPASYRKLKNILGLIEGLRQLPDKDKEKLQIDWYGDKTEASNRDHILPEAEELISRYGLEEVIRLHGTELRIEEKIKAADVVGIFSFFEGLPNAICEGMACGKAILASKVADLPLLLEDKVNGKLFDPRDIKAITAALHFMINLSPENLQKMGELNRQKAETLFDSKKVAAEYLKLMQ